MRLLAAGTPSVTESPFFNLAASSGGLSGNLGFNNTNELIYLVE